MVLGRCTCSHLKGTLIRVIFRKDKRLNFLKMHSTETRQTVKLKVQAEKYLGQGVDLLGQSGRH